MAERFHIAEWYGQPFEDLTQAERVAFAGHKVGSATMKKVDVDRLIQLKEAASHGDLKPREQARLEALRANLARQDQYEKTCPFRTDSAHPTCTKPGGVCSLRLYSDETDKVEPVARVSDLLCNCALVHAS